jgi:hypothetical protein
MTALCDASVANIWAYAKRMGAEYRLLRGDVFRPNLSAPCQKLFMLDVSFDAYETVVMLDTDMFAVKGLAENVFELDGAGLFSDYTRNVFRRCQERHPGLTDANYAYWGGAIYRLSRELRQRLRVHISEDELQRFSANFEDEGIMHRLAMLAKVPQDRIPDRWCQCSYRPNPESAAMIHVRTKVAPGGPKRTKLENYRSLQQLGVLD